MKKILMTGGTGQVGRAAAARLIEHGFDVLVIGRREEMDVPGGQYAVCDVLDYDHLLDLMRDCDGVVHLAAIPSPGGYPEHMVYRANALGTFNVFAAAETVGIGRVVQASSINAFGGVFGNTDIQVDYLPVDEAHPTNTTDVYSFSKQTVESIGEYFWRRSGISSVALRLPGVHRRIPERRERFLAFIASAREALDELAAMPETARRERTQRILDAILQYRSLRPSDFRPKDERPRFEMDPPDPLAHMFNWSRFDLCSGLDDRDSAQAIEKSLTVDYDGAHVLFVTDSHNVFGYDGETLARLLFPDVTQRTKPLDGDASLIDIDKARALIGFEPEHPIYEPPSSEPGGDA